MAIGFEFATNIRVGATLPKGTRLSRGTGWTMEVDGPEVEFVVAPVTERERLQFVMNVLTTFVTSLQQAFQVANGSVRTEDSRHLFPNAPALELTRVGPSISCVPQVTAGVRLARMRVLFAALADPTRAAAAQYLSSSAFYAHRLDATRQIEGVTDPSWPDHTPSPQLKGLLRLIALYLMQGNGSHGVRLVKYVTFIMSRTKFGTLFQQLPSEEYEHYRRNPNEWVRFVCNTVMLRVHEQALDPDGPVIGQRISDGGNLAGDDRASIPIKRERWLKSMLDGRDSLSAAAKPIAGPGMKPKYVTLYSDSSQPDSHRLRGLAELGDKMDVITYRDVEERAAILELRARQQEVPFDRWTAFALASFDFFELVNTADENVPINLAF
jgi:hypothetical protein